MAELEVIVVIRYDCRGVYSTRKKTCWIRIVRNFFGTAYKKLFEVNAEVYVELSKFFLSKNSNRSSQSIVLVARWNGVCNTLYSKRFSRVVEKAGSASVL